MWGVWVQEAQADCESVRSKPLVVFVTALRSVGRLAYSNQSSAMSVPRTVPNVLEDHMTLEVEGIDRMYLNVYVPQLQWDRGVVGAINADGI